MSDRPPGRRRRSGSGRGSAPKGGPPGDGQPATQDTPPSPDGGRNALFGYLYQIIETVGLQAQAHLHSVSPEEGHCDLVALVRQGTLTHEDLGQDAVASYRAGGHDETLAIQFKASPAGREIDWSELVEILDTFDMSRRRVQPDGRIFRCALITNRRLHRKARGLYDVRESDEARRELRPVRRMRKGKPVGTWAAALQHYGGAEELWRKPRLVDQAPSRGERARFVASSDWFALLPPLRQGSPSPCHPAPGAAPGVSGPL